MCTCMDTFRDREYEVPADNWLHAINDGNIVGCILVDFRKAFEV